MAQINKPGEYFNTVLYTGNGSTQSITGVGFKPDWIWLKERSSTGNHKINDVIRGTTKYLSSNLANAEDTTGSGIQSYDSDGFSISNATDINDNTVTYAAWNWLAAGSTPSKTYTVKVVDDSGNKYRFDDFGTSAVTLEISEGGTYTFDQSDSSNSGHPLRFSTTSDGTHGGGSEYTTGVTTNGTPGSAGAYTRITVAASAPTLYYYCTNHSGMGGTANTPTTNSFSNFDGSIQSNISPNTIAGFSIVSYTGTGANATLGHGLGVTPKMIIFKKRNGAPNWSVYHTSIGATKYLELNTTAASQTATDRFNDTEPTSSVFSVGTENQTNASSGTYIAYCFAEKKGFSKFGSYTGNGSSNGTFVYTGFKPAFLIMKRTNSAGTGWIIKDNKRSGTAALQNFGQMNPNQTENPSANTNNAENKASAYAVDILSNGFKFRGTGTQINESGSTYIYMAFAEEPLVGTNNIPATAR
jgi:hypothetical protein